MSDEKLSFEISGDAPDMDWDPGEWVDSETREEFEEQLLDIAEENSSWGISLVGKSIEELWEQVRLAKATQQ